MRQRGGGKNAKVAITLAENGSRLSNTEAAGGKTKTCKTKEKNTCLKLRTYTSVLALTLPPFSEVGSIHAEVLGWVGWECWRSC